jgi:hypothetical protein
VTRRYVWIEDIGAGQWHLTNGKDSIYIPKNLELVPIAEAFGMKLRHKPQCYDRRSTDGTVACENCGQSADAFFGQAYRYLEPRVEWGVRIVDPGYFTEAA